MDSQRGTSGALIEWFYEDREASFVQAGNFMQQLIKGFDRRLGTQHNFRAVRALCRVFQRLRGLHAGWMDEWVDALTFDALIGNTDRHQDNWGFLFVVQDGKVKTKLSPWYDNGTSLGHERWEAHVAGWRDEEYLRYVRRGNHHMRWLEDSPARCGFFEMPRLLIELHPVARERMRVLIDRLDFGRLEEFLAECRALPHPVPLEIWRSQFVVRLIKLRRDLLLKEIA